jgi:hypothetical protein
LTTSSDTAQAGRPAGHPELHHCVREAATSAVATGAGHPTDYPLVTVVEVSPLSV